MIPPPDFPAGPRRAQIAPGTEAGVTEQMIAAVVRGFYAKARRDPALGPIFARAVPDEAWEAHLSRICDFWSAVLLMSGRFSGAPLSKHMALEGLTPALFDRWLALFAETAREVCPPGAAALFIARSEMIAQSLQLGIAAARR